MGEEERRGLAFSLGKFMFSECERRRECVGEEERRGLAFSLGRVMFSECVREGERGLAFSWERRDEVWLFL